MRGVLNIAHRMSYPFLGVMSRAMGVDISAVSFAISSRSFIGFAVPFVSPISDIKGRKFGMLLGLSIFIVAILIVIVHPTFTVFSVALILSILGKYIFDPSVLAYLGDKIPYQKRGLAISFTEMGWSFAFILGIPLAALLIDRFGWSAPYYMLLLFGLISLAGIYILIPKVAVNDPKSNLPVTSFLSVLSDRRALLALNVGLWSTAGNEIVNLIFGVWLEDTFYVKLSALAIASAVIGFSELGGEGLVALFTDKLGKPRALAIGLAASMVSAYLLPSLATSQTGALIGLFFFYITFEFVMVSHIPLMTEVMPKARATAMSLNLVGFSIGRAIGAFSAPLIYKNFGFGVVTIFAVGFNIIAIFALFFMAGNEILGRKPVKVS